MICRECRSEDGPFKKNPLHKNSGICKKCHSKYCRNREKAAKAKINPSKWFQCDDCDETFHITNNNKKMNTECIYCGSEEIQTYAEMLGIKQESKE